MAGRLGTNWRKYVSGKSSYPFVLGILLGTGLKDYFEGIYEELKSRLEREDSLTSGIDQLDQKYGLPSMPNLLNYTSHTLLYDNSKKLPSWVAECVTKDQLNGNADRSQCTFKQDNQISKKFRSKNEDYFGSGFARGHMAPAADMKASQKGMKDTFYLSNIVPQNFENNGKFWYRMESYCRSLAKKYENVYIISGPLFKPSTDHENREYVTYQVIGENQVAVPSHLFKVILVERNNQAKAIGSFIVPNTPINDQKKLKEFQTPLGEIEKWTGHEFFPKLNKEKVGDLCVVDGCRMISQKLVEMYSLSRQLKKCKTLEELDNIWKTVQDQKIQVDKQFMDEFTKQQNILKRKKK